MDNGNQLHLVQTAAGFVKRVQDIDKRTEELEKQLKELKGQRTQIVEYDLPDLMFENGVSQLKLLDDTKIEVKPFYYARVDKEKLLVFFEWLRNNGHGGLIKAHFEVWQKDANTMALLVEFCRHFNIEYQVKEDVHWKTLEKWFQEVITKGINVDTTLFNNHVGRIASIK